MHVQRRFRCHGIFRCLLLTRTPSSTYDDLCALLEKIKLKPDGTCPDPLPQFKIPCRCPLPGGSWDIPPVDINIPKPASIPSWLTNVSCACLLSVSRSLSLSLSLSFFLSLSLLCPFLAFWQDRSLWRVYNHPLTVCPQGDYSAHVVITEASGAQMFCFDIELSLKSH
jgi:hypothetical protein